MRDDLKTLQNAPRTAIVERKGMTASLEQLEDAMDSLLYDTLDKLVNVLEPQHPKFCAQYRTARKIVDYKGKSNGPGENGEENPAGAK